MNVFRVILGAGIVALAGCASTVEGHIDGLAMDAYDPAFLAEERSSYPDFDPVDIGERPVRYAVVSPFPIEPEEIGEATQPDGSADSVGDLGPLGGYLNEGESFARLPDAGPRFWGAFVTPDLQKKYQAVRGRTFCTKFLGDILLEKFDDLVYEAIFPNGPAGNANDTFIAWTKNPNLVRLNPEEVPIGQIQQLADKDYLIVMAYYYQKVAGHVAFIGHSGLTLTTMPVLRDFQGTKGAELEEPYLPVVVQAGVYTGITTMQYATNGWLSGQNYESGVVRFYLVKIPKQE